MDYFIGVDAGGTKTTAVAYGKGGAPLAEFIAGPGNLTVYGDTARDNIASAVAGTMAKASGNCVFIGVGIAGFDGARTPQQMKELLWDRFAVPSRVVNDGELALCAAHGLGDGIVVVGGTGSIAYGRAAGTIARRGGWGHMLADRGSAWSVAADALRQALGDDDDGKPMDALAQALVASAGKTRLRELVELTYQAPKAELAKLAAAVAQLASVGDQRACEILLRAGSDLAELAAGLIARLGLAAPPVCCAGSMLERNEIVRAAFAERLQMLCPQATVLDRTLEPTRGALALYQMERGD